MNDVLDELKKWVPLYFYDKEREETSIVDSFEWFYRSFFHLMLSFLIVIVFMFAFVFVGTKISEELLTARMGQAITYTSALSLGLVPFRITRYPSYLIYRRLFKHGLYCS